MSKLTVWGARSGLALVATFLSACQLNFVDANACETANDCAPNALCVAQLCVETFPNDGGLPLRDDGGFADGGLGDGGPGDGGPGDGGPGDGGPSDGGPGDGGPSDGGPSDGGPGDGGPSDGGLVDSGPPDAGFTLPTAVDDSFGLYGQLLVPSGSVLDNDLAGDALGLVAVLDTAPGGNTTVELSDAGLLTVTSTESVGTTLNIRYRACDAFDATRCSSLATIFVRVEDNSPFASDDVFQVDEDVPVNGTLNVLDNDFSPTALSLAAETVGTLPPGVALAASGDVTLTLAPNLNGTLSFQYRVRDTAGGISEAASVSIVVRPINDPPEIQSAQLNNSTVIGQVTRTATVVASDVDLEALRYDFSESIPGVSISQTAPTSATATVTFNGTTPPGNYTIGVVVTDPAGANASSTIDFSVQASTLIPVVSPTAALFPDASASLNASGSTTNAPPLSFQWTGMLPQGVSLSGAQTSTPLVSVNRAQYYSGSAHAAQTLSLTVDITDVTGNTAQRTVDVTILDERGVHVDGASSLLEPCGHQLRPCSLISAAFASRAELESEGLAGDDEIRVLEGAAIIEPATLVMDAGLDLRCGFQVNQGNWVQGSGTTAIDVDAATGILHSDTSSTEISQCDITVTSTTPGEDRAGIVVANAVQLTSSTVVGSLENNANSATAVVLSASSTQSEILNSVLIGSAGEGTSNVVGLNTAAPVLLTDSTVEGGAAIGEAVGLRVRGAVTASVVRGSVTGGRGGVAVFGILALEDSIVTTNDVDIYGASLGTSAVAAAVESRTHGSFQAVNSRIWLGAAQVTATESGVSVVIDAAGSLSLTNTDVSVVQNPALPAPGDSAGIRTTAPNATGSTVITGGSIVSGPATSSWGVVSVSSCMDIALTNVDITVGAAEKMVGFLATGTCTATLTNVGVDVDNVTPGGTFSDRAGVMKAQGSLSATTVDVTLGNATTTVNGIVLSGITASGAATLNDVTVTGGQAPSSIGLLATDASQNIDVVDLTISGFAASAGGYAAGLSFENGCVSSTFGRVHITMGTAGATAVHHGVMIYGPASTGGCTVYSSYVHPGTASSTAAVHTLGESPERVSNRRSVAVLGSVLHSGDGPTAAHACVEMEHLTLSNERALDVVGVAMFADKAGAFGFVEECGDGNNHNGTRVGRAENNAFDTQTSIVLLRNAFKTGSNCFENDVDTVSALNVTTGYAASNVVNDRSISGNLAFTDDVTPAENSIVIDEAPSLVGYVPPGLSFVDFFGNARPSGGNDVGAVEEAP